MKVREQNVLQALSMIHPLETSLWYDQYEKAYRGREKAGPAKGNRWNLSLKDFWGLVLQAGGRCQLTGQPFDRYYKSGPGKRPFIPSLDRIDSNKGYEVGNIRLVTSIVNLALNDFGSIPFFEMVKNAMMSPAFGAYIASTGGMSNSGNLGNMLPFAAHDPVVQYVIQTHAANAEIDDDGDDFEA